MAEHWWDFSGPFKPLHQLNPTRCRFILSAVCDNFGLDASLQAPLAGLRVLDVGCGGGILSESLARMGATVDGIDVNQEGINAATSHASLNPELQSRLRYRVTTVEELAASNEALYDAVIASEVIEHVASVPSFCAAVVQATKSGGSIIFTTLNRTVRAYALAVVAAEQVLRWVPPGTHDWSKFLSPEELAAAVDAAAGEVGDAVVLEQVAGMVFDPLTGKWRLGRDTGVNYAMYFHKKNDNKE